MTSARTSSRQSPSITVTSITMTSASGPVSARSHPPMAIMSASRSVKCTWNPTRAAGATCPTSGTSTASVSVPASFRRCS
ncbi:hypothetical protein SVIOM74S_00303 [Streptomyces violarus]